MKNHELRSPLIQSGIILLLCVFFIYAFAAPDSGGVLGVISSLFTGLVFLLGLGIAIGTSIVVLFSIYWSLHYLYDPEHCILSFQHFKDTLTHQVQSLRGCCKCPSSGTIFPPTTVTDLPSLLAKQGHLERHIKGVEGSISSLENSLRGLSSAQRHHIEDLGHLEERISQIEKRLATMASREQL